MVRKVVFVRHGESQGNSKNVFTGWDDTPLSLKGEQEAEEAGLCIKARGLTFDVVFTSVLSRAVKTAEHVCKASGNSVVPVLQSWRLNARHSGGLQGLTQAEAVALYGESNVTLWRSSYDILPACVERSDPRHPVNDPRYADVPVEDLPPGGESLAHTVARVVPYWKEHIIPRILAGESILVVAHKNSLRALWKELEKVSDEDALDIKLMPASAPVVFEFQDEVGPDGHLVFAKKYSLNAPTFNPKVDVSTKATSKVCFLRHAESLGNAKAIYTGWEDTALSLKGEQQAVVAGLLLKAQGIKFDSVFTSVLQRSVKTAELACNASGNSAAPVIRSWRLNAIHSGVLQGLTEAEAFAMYGEEKVRLWRSRYDVLPNCVEQSDPRHPANDPLYAGVPAEDLPGGESMSQVLNRVVPYWRDCIVPHIQPGKSVFVVAHKDSLKALFQHIEDARGEEALDGTSMTAPLVYEFSGGSDGGRLTFVKKFSLSTLSPELGLNPERLGLTRFGAQLGVSSKTVGQAVFLRHGESECNLKEAFTGWENSGMTEKGVKQAKQAGNYLREHGFKFDVVFTSVLSRATESVKHICDVSGNLSVPIVKSWRLNARHPGVLQGLTKPEAIEKYGEENVNLWRGSYDVLPECVDLSDPRHPVNDPLYADVPPSDLPPGGESLARTVDRIVPYWRDAIAPRIQAGESVLVVGHKNSLKALFMYLEDTSAHDLFDVKPVSATAPLVMEFGDCGFSGGLTVLRKFFVKHTPEEGVATSRCRDGSYHK